VELLKDFEGCKLTAYVDPHTGGLPITIGWGSTRKRNGQPFHLGEKISLEEANALLDFDIRNRFLPVLKKIPYWSEMNDNQRGTLLSFAYNLGAGFYGGSGFNTITRNLSQKDWKSIPETLKLYRNPGSNVEAGLLRRRVAEGKLWIS
jgi:GH24 family phage-related lysozyme (muramidase)